MDDPALFDLLVDDILKHYKKQLYKVRDEMPGTDLDRAIAHDLAFQAARDAMRTITDKLELAETPDAKYGATLITFYLIERIGHTFNTSVFPKLARME
jgi:hypothetical protein